MGPAGSLHETVGGGMDGPEAYSIPLPIREPALPYPVDEPPFHLSSLPLPLRVGLPPSVGFLSNYRHQEDFLEMSLELLTEVYFHPKTSELAPSMHEMGVL